MFLAVDDISPDIVDILLLLLKHFQLLLEPLLGNIRPGLSVSQVVCCLAGELSDDGVITAGDLEDVEVVQTPDGDPLSGLELEVIVVPGDRGLGGGVDLTLELQATLGLEGDVRLHHLHLGGVENVQGEDIPGCGLTHAIGGLTHKVSSILPADVLQQHPGLSQSSGQHVSSSPPDHLRLGNSGPRASQCQLGPKLHCQVRPNVYLCCRRFETDNLVGEYLQLFVFVLHLTTEGPRVNILDMTDYQVVVHHVVSLVPFDSQISDEEYSVISAPEYETVVSDVQRTVEGEAVPLFYLHGAEGGDLGEPQHEYDDPMCLHS